MSLMAGMKDFCWIAFFALLVGLSQGAEGDAQVWVGFILWLYGSSAAGGCSAPLFAMLPSLCAAYEPHGTLLTRLPSTLTWTLVIGLTQSILWIGARGVTLLHLGSLAVFMAGLVGLSSAIQPEVGPYALPVWTAVMLVLRPT